MTPSEFESYAFQELTREEIRSLAKQYEGVDMAKLVGANADRFPLSSEDESCIMWWTKAGGMVALVDEDDVRAFATAEYLKANAYPVFTNIDEARQWVEDHDWPRE